MKKLPEKPETLQFSVGTWLYANQALMQLVHTVLHEVSRTNLVPYQLEEIKGVLVTRCREKIFFYTVQEFGTPFCPVEPVKSVELVLLFLNNLRSKLGNSRSVALIQKHQKMHSCMYKELIFAYIRNTSCHQIEVYLFNEIQLLCSES